MKQTTEKLLKKIGLTLNSVIIILILVIIYFLYCINNNLSMEYFTMGAQTEGGNRSQGSKSNAGVEVSETVVTDLYNNNDGYGIARVMKLPRSMPDHETYRIIFEKDEELVDNVYTLYGSSNGTLECPAAKHAEAPFGVNAGGVDPVFFSMSEMSEFDSWLTVGITDGSDSGELSSIGIDWESWTDVSTLSVDDGAVFFMNPNNGPTGTTPVVLAQLTLPVERENVDFKANLQGRSKGDNIGDWQGRIEITIPGSMSGSGVSGGVIIPNQTVPTGRINKTSLNSSSFPKNKSIFSKSP